MKIVGIIGGIGPESTIEYYRLIIAAYRERVQDGSYPRIIVNSIDLKKMISWFEANELAKVVEYLVDAVQGLERAGADFGLLAANTPHIVFDEVRRRSTIPLLSIVEATCAEAKGRGLKRPALFGTRFTMRGRFYAEVFSREGIQLLVPRQEEQDYIHTKYMNELVEGRFLPETREGLLAVVNQMKARDEIDGVILGGTELPLILPDEEQDGVPFLDTTRIHVKAAVAELLS